MIDNNQKVYNSLSGHEREEAFLALYEKTAMVCWICVNYKLYHSSEKKDDSIQNKTNNNIDFDFPRRVREDFKRYNRSDLYKEGKLFDEINNNLENRPDKEARIRYIKKMLSSFCLFASKFYPIQQIKFYEDSPYDESMMIEELKKEAKTFIEIAEKGLCEKPVTGQESMEYCFSCFCYDMRHFARRLAAVLLTHKIDLMEIMKECGVYLTNNLSESDYFDSKYIPTIFESIRILKEIKKTSPNTDNQRCVNSQSTNLDIDDDSPALWILENKEQFQRFELKNVNYQELYSTLTDNSIGIINYEITYNYFIDIVQRAQFGKIYNHSDTKKGKFRLVVTSLTKHINTKKKRKEYKEVAAVSMQLINEEGRPKTDFLGKFNVNKEDSFRIKIKEIL